MSLIQQETPAIQQGNTLAIETQLLQRVETSLLKVTEGVSDLKNGQQLLNTKLFGDANSENDGGRLPRVEFLAASNASVLQELRDRYTREVIRDGPVRIEALEKGQVKFGVITGLASVVGSAVLTIILKLVFHL